MLYAQEMKLAKIGMTTSDLPQRVRNIQNMCPVRLEVLAAFRSTDAWGDEIHLHRHYAKQRRHGEWFEATDDLIDWAWEDSRTPVNLRKAAQAAVDAVWNRRGRGDTHTD